MDLKGTLIFKKKKEISNSINSESKFELNLRWIGWPRYFVMIQQYFPNTCSPSFIIVNSNEYMH